MKGASEDRSIDVATYLDAWLLHSKARVRLSTWRGYEGVMRLYVVPALGKKRLEDLEALDVQRLYASLLDRDPPLSGGTVLNVHLAFKQALSQAVRWSYLDHNPADGAQPPRPRRRELQVVDVEVANAILHGLEGSFFELPAAIAIATGMRRGEVLGLRWGDLDEDLTLAQVRRVAQPGERETIYEEPKTRRSKRSVVLPSFLRPHLERQRQNQAKRRAKLGRRWKETGHIVDRGNGEPVNPNNFSGRWTRCLSCRGLPPIRFHDLRHAHATLMLLQGVHPKIVSERLGHASIGITLDTYSHVLPSMQQEAADAFDQLFVVAG